jgi:hypothetical protein
MLPKLARPYLHMSNDNLNNNLSNRLFKIEHGSVKKEQIL